MGVGAASEGHRQRGRQPVAARRPEGRRHPAKQSVASWKVREGMPIGAKVTLRGDRMWEFLDRLLSLALPRIRDSAACPARRAWLNMGPPSDRVP
jgi:hypothetical protein